MKMFLIFVIMIVLHTAYDFHLQGILSAMKQKGWWKEHINDIENTMYKNDYKMALGVHAFEWAFVIMLPMLFATYNKLGTAFDWASIRLFLCYFLAMVGNAFIHYGIDDMKANEGKINLIEDQCVHIIQIFITWAYWTITFGW